MNPTPLIGGFVPLAVFAPGYTWRVVVDVRAQIVSETRARGALVG